MEKSLDDLIKDQQTAWNAEKALQAERRPVSRLDDLVPKSVAKAQQAWERKEQIYRLRTVHKLYYHEIADIFDISVVRARGLFLRAEELRKSRRLCPVVEYFRDGSIQALADIVNFYDCEPRK